MIFKENSKKVSSKSNSTPESKSASSADSSASKDQKQPLSDYEKKFTPEELEKLRENRDQMKKILLELDARSPKAKPNVPPLWKRLRLTYATLAIIALYVGFKLAMDRRYMRMLKVLETDDY